MNKVGLNILLVLFLSGCGTFNSRTDNKGEPISKNAPIFISPNTNQNQLNKGKANTNSAPANKQNAIVSAPVETFVMVKQNDLNGVIVQKTNEVLLNIKKSNANSPQPNKDLDAAIDSHIKNSLVLNYDSISKVSTVSPIVVENKKVSNSGIHPFFAFVLVAMTICSLCVAVGYFFFYRKKASNEPSTTPQSPTVATEKPATTATENNSNKDTEGKKD